MKTFLKLILAAAIGLPLTASADTAVVQRECASTIQVDVDPWADLMMQGDGNITFNIARNETTQVHKIGYYCMANFDGELRLAFNLPLKVTQAGYTEEESFSVNSADKQPVVALVPMGDAGLGTGGVDYIAVSINANGNHLIAGEDYGQGWVKLNLIPAWELP